MTNISFDNPYLLLLIIPLALLVIIPFCIAIRKENKSKSSTVALICHLAMVILSVLAVAGMKHTTVITKTEIFVLADVSNSTSHKTDLIDGYINELCDGLGSNTDLGVIAFAKDVKLHTEPGKKFTTVRDSGVDDSATDIVAALNYASELFGGDSIKRIVLYTDGMSTDPDAGGALIRAFENLADDGVYVDVVYIDSNLSDGELELQISDIEFSASTYKGHKSSANVLIEAATASDAIVRLAKGGEKYLEQALKLSAGYNSVSFELDTSAAGETDYTVSVYSLNDSSEKNNTLSFTQRVNENVSVLLISDKQTDTAAVKAIYGENAVIDSYIKPSPPSSSSLFGPAQSQKPFDVPMTVEELCKYDEIILSNVKLEEINNSDAFVKALDICVSVFGKSLITAGDHNLHNSEASSVVSLNSMLPVRFGNDESDPKLYTILIDSSRSMEFKNFDYFKMAKSAGIYLLDMLNEGDYFALGWFAGETHLDLTPREVNEENLREARDYINSLVPEQGTMIGRALDEAYDMLDDYSMFADRQLMLISDGMAFEGGEVYADDPLGSAAKLKEIGVIVSTLNSGNDEGVAMMQNIAAAGGGKYYFSKSSSELADVMFEEISDDVNETFIDKESEIIINRPNDSVLTGVGELSPVSAFMYARPKASAENILYANYVKSSGAVVKVPLYSYWNYGNGRVSTLTTALGGEWTAKWTSAEDLKFLSNIATTNIPKEHNNYPYTVSNVFDGKYIHIEIVPAVINPDAKMTVTVTTPDGQTLTELLTFDSYRYFYKFEASAVGKYRINTAYSLLTVSYASESIFNIPYSPEYDSFAAFSPAPLHSAVRDNGTVTENGNAVLTADKDRLDSYVISFTVPFLAAAAAIYIIDTVIRKLRWQDIVSFFKKRQKGALK